MLVTVIDRISAVGINQITLGETSVNSPERAARKERRSSHSIDQRGIPDADLFMVIGQIAPPDRFQIRPPTSRSELSAKERSITIAVTRDGSLALNETPVALEALIPRLKLALDAGRQQGMPRRSRSGRMQRLPRVG